MDQTYMKERPVLPLLLSMGIPMILSLMVGALYNIIDSIFVASIGENAMTALSLVYPIQNLSHAIAVGFGVGMNALIARRLGEGKHKDANKAASCGLFLSAIHGILATLLGMAVIVPYLKLFTSNKEILSYAIPYFFTVSLFFIVDNLGMAIEKIYQSVGEMMKSMGALLVGCAVNLILDPILIFGPGPLPALGVRGAAIATGLGQLASLLMFALFYKKKSLSIRLSLGDIRPEKTLCKGMYSVGIAATLNLALPSIMLSALNSILVPFSETYVLVLGGYYKLQSLLYQAACGLVLGMRPLMSYNYGAGEYGRMKKIYRYSLMIVALILLSGALACQLAPGFLIGLFTTNGDTVALGIGALHILSIGFLFSTISVVSAGALEALGKGTASLCISLLRYILIILPAAYLLSRFLGADGVWNAFWITEAASAVAAGLIYRSATKRQ